MNGALDAARVVVCSLQHAGVLTAVPQAPRATGVTGSVSLPFGVRLEKMAAVRAY